MTGLPQESTGKEIHPQNSGTFSEKKFHRLLDSLQSLILSLQWKGDATTWDQYYDEANQRDDYVLQKKKVIIEWLSELPETLLRLTWVPMKGHFLSCWPQRI